MEPGAKRVLVLTNMYPPHHFGGYELSCRDVVERWRATGHEVEVLTTSMRVDGVAEAPGESDRGVHRELEWYWDRHVLTSPSPYRRLRVERANHRALAAALRRHRPDVISVWNMGVMSLGLLAQLVDARTPIVYVVCDDWLIYGPELDAWTRMFDGRPRLGRLASAITRVPTRLPDLGSSGTFCFVSETTRDRAAESSRWRFPDATVVYSGIDMTDFPDVPTAARSWGARLLYVGRLDERKGVDTAIRALARLDETATLQIIGKGDDSYVAHLEALAADLEVGSRVRFSSAERSSLATHYRSADALVFPSTWTEPFGLVPLEAMACGTPVIATGMGGSSEFLSDGVNCLQFPPWDDSALAARVEELAGDAALREHLVERGRATAAELTVDRLAERLEAWHVAAADRFRDGRPAEATRPKAVIDLL